MSDIFLSYARQDKKIAQRLVDVFSSKGWSVWWDHAIHSGAQWEFELERHLEAASCVVVLWSAASVGRSWVRTEASFGRDRGILVPVKLDDTDIPHSYRLIQTSDLRTWAKESNLDALDGLLIELESKIVGSRKAKASRQGNRVRASENEESRSRRSDLSTFRPYLGERGASRKPSSDSDPINVFVTTESADAADALAAKSRLTKTGILRTGQQNLVRARASISEIPLITRSRGVMWVEPADRILFKDPIRGSNAASHTLPHRRTREPFLLGIIGVQGFDFAHPAFLDQEGTTCFVSIWDQAEEGHEPPTGFTYGSEIRQEHMEEAVVASADCGLPPQLLEPQSQMIPSSVDTHIASVAAGRHPGPIAAVLLPCPTGNTNTRMAACDSGHLADAVDYLFAVGDAQDLPVSIVMSVGTNGGAHDAGSATARWLDAALIVPGRSICVPATDASEQFEGPRGPWTEALRGLHTEGRIRGNSLSERIEWIVMGDGSTDLVESHLDIWYEASDRIAVKIEPPTGSSIGWVSPGEYLENQELPGGGVLYISNELAAPGSRSSRISCTLAPRFGELGAYGIQAGMWVVRLTGLTIRDGRYRGWITRDCPCVLDKLDRAATGTIPSFFSAHSARPNYAVTGVSCAERVITVANLDTGRETMHPSSPRGPTRDGHPKPEILAPGTDILGANGFDYANPPWIAMTSATVASAFVAGVVGRMLAADRQLTAERILEILRRTASPLPGAGWEWHPDSCFGVVNEEASTEEAVRRPITDED